jgi:phosphoribosylaminoimidazole-succinocarboxamide synthase
MLADEVHTPDSSRYWLLDSYQDRLENGIEPEMLDKEFVRGFLLKNGYKGEGTPPVLDDEFRVDTSIKYIQVAEKVTGTMFSPCVGDVKEEIDKVLKELSL